MVFATAFERLSYNNQERVRVAVETTAASVTPGGAVFGVLNDILKTLKNIEKGGGVGGGASAKSSILSVLVGKRKLVGIGESFKLIAEAINSITSTGADAKEKVEAITNGIGAVIGLGKDILKFSATLALATPLLIIATPFALLFSATLKIIISALNWAAKSMSKDAVDALNSLEAIGKSIVIFGGFLVLAAPLYLIGMIAAPLIAFVIGTIGLAFWALDKLGVAKTMENTAKSLMWVSLSILTLGLTLTTTYLLLSQMGGGNFYKTTLQILGAVLLVGLTFTLIGVVSSIVKRGAFALMFASLAIATISIGLLIFKAAIPPNKEGWTTLGQVGAALVGIGVIMAAAGALALPIALGAIVLGLAGLSLLVISVGLNAIASVFKNDGLDNMLAPSGQKTRGFLGIGGGREMSKLEYLMLSLANSFVINPFKMAAIRVTAPAMMLAGDALYYIAKGLKKVQDLNLNPDVMVPKIESIITVLSTAFGNVGKEFPGGRKSLFARVMGMGRQSAVADGISAVTGMGEAIHDIATGIKMMADLKFPIYKGTKIVGYTDLRDPDIFNKVTENVSYLVKSLSSVFGEIGASPNAKKSWWFGRSNIKRGMKVVEGLGKPIDKLSKTVMNFSELNVNSNGIAQKLRSMIRAITEPFKEEEVLNDAALHKLVINRIEDIGDSLQKISRYIYTWNRFVDGFGKYAKHFGTFKTHVNDLDSENLKLVTSLFSSLSQFDSNSIGELGVKLTQVINTMKNELSRSIQSGSAQVVENNTTTADGVITAIQAAAAVPGGGPAATGANALLEVVGGLGEFNKFWSNFKTDWLKTGRKSDLLDVFKETGLDQLDDVLATLNEVLEKLNTKL